MKRTKTQPSNAKETFKEKQQIVLATPVSQQLALNTSLPLSTLDIKIPSKGTAISSLEEQELLNLIEYEKQQEIKDQLEENLPLEVHPALIESRNKGLELLKSLTEKAQILKEKLNKQIEELPPASYRELIEKYLGTNYTPPTIDQLAFPNYKTFSIKNTQEQLKVFNESQSTLQLTKLKMLTAEAANTSFDGPTSIALGHAFGMLSSTKNGEEFVINHDQTTEYLKFAETVRHIPLNYILENPLVVAHKLIHAWSCFSNKLLLDQQQVTTTTLALAK